MKIANLLNQLRISTDPARQQAMVDAYIPILRPILIPACGYYLFVTWEHWQTQTGLMLVAFSLISTTTAFGFYLFHKLLANNRTMSLAKLELHNLAMHLFMYLNLLSYLLVYNVETRYIYFVLLAFIFAITGATTRTVMISVPLTLATLYWFSTSLPEDLYAEYVSIVVATAFASVSMTGLLRHAIIRQIDARLLADELTVKARAIADADMLTGIPNRRAIFEKIDRLIEQRTPFWLGIFDLDGFKGINDVYGHSMGDRLLRASVARATELHFEGAMIGRIGGDEFAVVLTGNVTESQVRALAGSWLKAITAPYIIDNQELSVGASAGFSHYPDMGMASTQLYEQADFALYKAKARFRGQCIVFDTTDSKEMENAIAIERELREGNLEQELFLLFQPQYSPSRQRIVSFEALARWQNPRLGLVRPDDFIRVAERSGFIQKVTAILFRKGLAELKKWPDDISLSFNLSARDISDQTFVLSLLGQIMKEEISPGRLEFEITETAVMSDLTTSSAVLDRLRSSGCRVALDDFGSGYSSFQYLDQLPLDKVKIDRSFIRKVAHSLTSREIVAAIIALCSKLNLRCVLEGVETREEMAVLSALKPDLIQGYLFGRPMSGADATQLIASQQQSNTNQTALYIQSG
ncbi:EAL domain-containing protein [Agrobacterium sp. MA01]|uniref:putative bifunctional diguanylate cyclase/phosphodiesterase n=1 Tax=Agrobacterium sp. MA01 TaxID=2664893 RepID=UPI00129B55B0|nr:EAL domain-containing protein [Agrobacterium sp. MA01]QGG92186.1 EAL domain-containing protein [Agrobacterium sp. MA01]